MVRSNQDAGHSTLFNTTMGTIAGAGLGAGGLYGAGYASDVLSDRAVAKLNDRAQEPMRRINQKLADGVITPSQAARHTGRVERSYQKAFDKSHQGKLYNGLSKVGEHANKLKIPGGAFGAAVIGAGLIGGAMGLSKD